MKTAGTDRILTGIDGLDTVLNGGLVRGAAYIVYGPPGAGKTIFANQCSYNFARAGGRVLYVSLLAESHDRMMMHMSGLSFFDRSLVPSSIFYVSAFSDLQEGGLKGLLRLVFEESRRHDAGLVVLDGLFVARGIADDDKEFRRFVHEIQGQMATGDRTLLLLTNQQRGHDTAEQTMVDGGIEFFDDLKGVRAVRSLVVRKQRGGAFLRGRHHFRITDNGLEVYPRLEAVMNREPMLSETTERVATGIAGFDRLTSGGYPAASATVLAGPTGAGKTTIGLQFLSLCTPEAPGLMFGFYETPARLCTKARSIGIDIDGLLASGALEIIWISPAENLPDDIGRRLLDAVAARGVKRLFFDGIGALRHAFVYLERLPLFLNALNAALRESGTTTIFTLELPGLFMPENLTTADMSQMADNVVLTHYVRVPGHITRELLVLKLRDSHFDAFPEVFHITGQGLLFGSGNTSANRPDRADEGT